MKLDNLSDEQFETRLELSFTVRDWIAILLNLCLALRHPQNTGPVRLLAISKVKIIEDTLFARGFMDQEDIARVHQTE